MKPLKAGNTASHSFNKHQDFFESQVSSPYGINLSHSVHVPPTIRKRINMEFIFFSDSNIFVHRSNENINLSFSKRLLHILSYNKIWNYAVIFLTRTSLFSFSLFEV